MSHGAMQRALEEPELQTDLGDERYEAEHERERADVDATDPPRPVAILPDVELHSKPPLVPGGCDESRNIEEHQRKAAIEQPDGRLHLRPELRRFEFRSIAEVTMHHAPAREPCPERVQIGRAHV